MLFIQNVFLKNDWEFILQVVMVSLLRSTTLEYRLEINIKICIIPPLCNSIFRMRKFRRKCRGHYSNHVPSGGCWLFWISLLWISSFAREIEGIKIFLSLFTPILYVRQNVTLCNALGYFLNSLQSSSFYVYFCLFTYWREKVGNK